MSTRPHGGPDAHAPARWDFSTCANAAGPCPAALDAVRAADPTRYPDPASTAVRRALAALHGVEPARILPAASASEFIQRITAVTGRLRPGAVALPQPGYGDYAIAAAACGRAPSPAGTLRWYADPGSPLGQDGALPRHDLAEHPGVLDAVYAPLRLAGSSAWSAAARDEVFVLHSPNKALGLCGVRGAYAIAPARAAYDLRACCAALEAAAPSWPLSAQAESLLLSWATPAVQAWVASCRPVLSAWKARLQRRLAARGFTLQPGVAAHFVVRPPRPIEPRALRVHGVAVRDAASFGLTGWWRLSAQGHAAEEALMHALDRLEHERSAA